jgi:predicted short-subunit dehydrogenase-like oxidoreductase (DUF2520 family)
VTEFARPSAGGASFSGEPGAAEVAIVGAGRVGTSIGLALRAAGSRIVAASVRTPSSAARVRDVLPDVPLTSPEDAALGADVVVIAVPDDALAEVVPQVARCLRAGATVVHTSGIHGASVLAPCGERVAATHPAQAIPAACASLAGVWFGVTCSDAMRPWADRFVTDMGGVPFRVAEEDRPRYHAALAMASNFAVALAGDAGDLLGEPRLLEPLLRQTMANVIDLGADQALTGPVVRGDAGTVRAHLRALPPELIESYVANGRRTLERAVRAGRLDAAGAQAVAEALDEVMVR